MGPLFIELGSTSLNIIKHWRCVKISYVGQAIVLMKARSVDLVINLFKTFKK